MLLGNVTDGALLESPIDTAKVERLLIAIGMTYKSTPMTVPRFILFGPYLRLAHIHAQNQNAIKSVATALKALESLGFVITGAELPASKSSFVVEQWGEIIHDVVQAWICLWNAYLTFAPQWQFKLRRVQSLRTRFVSGRASPSTSLTKWVDLCKWCQFVCEGSNEGPTMRRAKGYVSFTPGNGTMLP